MGRHCREKKKMGRNLHAIFSEYCGSKDDYMSSFKDDYISLIGASEVLLSAIQGNLF